MTKRNVAPEKKNSHQNTLPLCWPANQVRRGKPFATYAVKPSRKCCLPFPYSCKKWFEDSGLAERFKDWAKKWGEDEFDACQLHRSTYSMLERHVMWNTAAQFAWQPEDTDGEKGRENTGATSSADHRPEDQQVDGGEAASTSAMPVNTEATMSGESRLEDQQAHGAETAPASSARTARTRKRIRHKSARGEDADTTGEISIPGYHRKILII